jgi:hypothetical protein
MCAADETSRARASVSARKDTIAKNDDGDEDDKHVLLLSGLRETATSITCSASVRRCKAISSASCFLNSRMRSLFLSNCTSHVDFVSASFWTPWRNASNFAEIAAS